jgi:hypothetical protein
MSYRPIRVVRRTRVRMPRVVRDEYRSVMQQDGTDDGGVPQL